MHVSDEYNCCPEVKMLLLPFIIELLYDYENGRREDTFIKSAIMLTGELPRYTDYYFSLNVFSKLERTFDVTAIAFT